MILDFCKRLVIAAAIALFIGILFVGATISYAHPPIDSELINAKIWPALGEVTDTYGTRDGTHYGIDIAAEQGTPVYAIEDGVVTKSYYSSSYGNVIFIEHPDGLETVYAHLHDRNAGEGDVISQGDTIGTVGNTGRSSGNHLHFEVHLGNWNIDKSNSIDPLYVLMDEPKIYALTEDDQMKMNLMEIQEVLSMRYSLVSEEDSSEKDKEENSNEKITYQVKKGDSLWGIAIENSVSVVQLQEENNLTDEIIKPGQQIVIPIVAGVHIVAQGDTLSEIAQETGVSLSSLKQINQLTDDDVIMPGMVLHLQ